MSSKKCIVCLRPAVNQVECDPGSLSLPLFLHYLVPTLEASGKSNYSANDTNTLTCCSSCQVFLVRVIKLNTKLNTLVSKVKQSCAARTTKIRAIYNAGQSIIEAERKTQEWHLQENHWEHQCEEGSCVGVGDTQPAVGVGDNEFRNYSDADARDHNDVIGNIGQYHEVGALVPVEGTSQDKAEVHEKCQLTSKDNATAGVSFNVYENNWLPKNLNLPKYPLLVKQISDREFIYLDKYPFQGTEFGFQCGLCSVIVMFCTYKRSPPWLNVVKHVKRRHMGDHNSTKTARAQQRCIEIAPNRFQYGKFLIVEVDGRYKCGECGILTMPARSARHKKQHILRHIRDQHENPSRTYACNNCGMTYNNPSSLCRHKITKHQSLIGQFPCSDCGEIFGNIIAAISHRRTIHRRLHRKKFFCESCGKVFSQKGFLDDHVAFVHNGRKMRECNVCGKKFSSRTGLNIHQNSHKEQSAYNCDICGMTFSKNSLFTRHKKLICRAQSKATLVDPSINSYEDNWLPKNLTLSKCSQLVKRLSERDFIYMDKYPFQGTEFGFKCGLCPIVVMFCGYKKSPPWQNAIKHIKRYHMGDPKVLTSKHIQRCVQIAPNRFQYGTYSIDWVDGLYKCGECGTVTKPAKPHKMQYILKHINDMHENASTTFVCEYCGVVYNAAGSLTAHKITKHGDPNGRFPCSECDKVFRNRVAAMWHRQSVHRKNPQNNFICETCGKKFSRKDLLEDHVAFVHKGLKLHECQECEKTFGTRGALKNHQNTHPGNRKYIYNISAMQSVEENHCPAISNVKDDSEVNSLGQSEVAFESLTESRAEHQLISKVEGGPSINAFKNDWLPKSLTMKSSQFVKQLSERDFIYKDEYPFQGTEFGFKCGLCPVVIMFCTYTPYAPWQNLIIHMKRHHVGDPKVQTIRTVQQKCIEVAPNRFQYGKYSFEKVDGMFKCGECDVFKKPSEQYGDSHREMRKHIMDKHENPSRTYACNDCGVVYKKQSYLNIHKTTKHVNPNGEFPCTECGKIFGSRRAALAHRRRVHLKLFRKKFMCEICGKDFVNKNAMEDHVAFVHNGQQMHECEECSKKFASRTALKTHKNNHTGRRKYVCDICGMDFTQQQSIKRHKKTAHSVDK